MLSSDASSSLPPRRAAHSSLVDIASEALLEVIFDRGVEPGAHMGIDAAAKMLGMSITPVREAMARLVTQGLLVQDANRGFTVAPLLTSTEFHALFTTRRVLEVAALQEQPDGTGASARLLAPDRVTSPEIEGIRELADRMRGLNHGGSYREFALFSRLDSAFHQRVVALSGNPFLINAWCGMNFHLHVSRLYWGGGVIDYREAVTEHDAIVAALSRRDPRGLVARATRHILRAERRLVRLLPTVSVSEAVAE